MQLYYSKDYRSRLPLGACPLSKALFSHLSSLARAVPGRARSATLQVGDWFKLITNDAEYFMRAMTPCHPFSNSLYDMTDEARVDVIHSPAALYMQKGPGQSETVHSMIPCVVEPFKEANFSTCQTVVLQSLPTQRSDLNENACSMQAQVMAGLLLDCIVMQDVTIDTWLNEFHLYFKVVHIVPSPGGSGPIFKFTKDTEIHFSHEQLKYQTAPLLPLLPSSLSMLSTMEQLTELLTTRHTHPIVSGPPDMGKSELVRHFCAQHALPLYILNPAKLYATGDFDSERKLRAAFDEALSLGQNAVLLIQNIDLLAAHPNMAALSETSGPALHTFKPLTSVLIDLVERPTATRLWMIGTTEKLENIDPRIRKSNRWSGLVMVKELTESDRYSVLSSFFANELDQAATLKQVASCTHGFSFSQLFRLCHAMQRHGVKMENGDDWIQSVNEIFKGTKVLGAASALLESDKDVWESVGGYQSVKKEISQAVDWPLKHSSTMQRLGLRPCSGILLHGPPGCSKTSLARLSAAHSHVHFIGISASDLYSCYVGESERYLREAFKTAKSKAPCILFLDELDALVGTRSLGDSSGGVSSGGGTAGPSSKDPVQERILSMLLNELDGIEERPGVMIMAATNRVDRIDPALLRPGRFDKVILVGLPDQSTRHQILELYTKKMPLLFESSKSAVLLSLSERMEGYSGADCENLCQEAAMIALRENPNVQHIEERHFEAALRVSKSNSSEIHQG